MTRHALETFIQDVYAPGLHIAFATAWFAGLDGGFAVLSGMPWRLTYLPLGAASFFLVLFYLRVLDEWKDLDYDKVHNPSRPLVRGTVSLVDVYWFLAITAVLVVGLQFVVPEPWSLAIIVLNLVYGLALVGLEKISSTARDNIFVNLVLTYPVNVALSVYACAAYLGRTGSELQSEHILLVAAFALAFLHYEFARKTSWPQHARPGKRLYSTALGETPAMLLALSFAAGAVAIAVSMFAPRTWLGFAPLLAFIPAIAGAKRFQAIQHLPSTKSPAPMTPFAMLFLTLFYVSILIVALANGVAL